MRSKLGLAIVLFGLLWVTVSCTTSAQSDDGSPTPESSGKMAGSPDMSLPAPSAPAGERAVARGNNRFAWLMYRHLRAGEKNASLFFSPYSLSTAFGMVYAGAKGTTASQMSTVFAFPSSPDELAAGLQAMSSSLTSRATAGRYDFSVANALWVSRNLKLVSAFAGLMKTRYGGAFEEVDFSQPEPVRQRINDFVSDKTRQRIKDIVPPGVLSPATSLVLANAVYFKSAWLSRFDKKHTQDAPFREAGGKTSTVPLMVQVRPFAYAHPKGLQVLAMPYANKDLSMVVLLPDADDGLPALEESLTAEKVDVLVDGLKVTKIRVQFPRFKLEKGFTMEKGMASALGMPAPFDASADFSGLSESRTCISQAIHKAFVEVGEEGTEASAATVIVMTRDGSSHEPSPPLFRADHPFVFMIRDNRTGAILFLGRVAQISS